jgi:hypothetical protein
MMKLLHFRQWLSIRALFLNVSHDADNANSSADATVLLWTMLIVEVKCNPLCRLPPHFIAAKVLHTALESLMS